MSEIAHFAGGPVGGVSKPLAGLGEIVLVPVDADCQLHPQGEPYAVAVYKQRRDEDGVKYIFQQINRKNGEGFTAEYVDGPIQGMHSCPQPPHFFDENLLVPLDEKHEEIAGAGHPSAVAIYTSKKTGNAWRFHFDRIEESGENLDTLTEMIDEQRTLSAINGFYDSPDYSIYTKTPSDDHPQVPVQVGHRKANVDEKIAPLIEVIWQSGGDTIGSCQEHAPGKSYIGFALRRHGDAFAQTLQQAGIKAESQQKKLSIKNADTGDVFEMKTINVTFPLADIPRIVELLGQNSA